jgi:hypothetical protein
MLAGKAQQMFANERQVQTPGQDRPVALVSIMPPGSHHAGGYMQAGTHRTSFDRRPPIDNRK